MIIVCRMDERLEVASLGDFLNGSLTEGSPMEPDLMTDSGVLPGL